MKRFLMIRGLALAASIGAVACYATGGSVMIGAILAVAGNFFLLTNVGDDE